MKSISSLFVVLCLLTSWIAVVEAQDETVTVEITNLPEGIQNGAFEVTITFSEVVVSFETGDIEFSDDSVDASVTELTTPDEGETDHKKVYTAEITPADDVNGDLTFQVAENVVKSANADVDAEDNNAASDSHTVKVDLVPPAVSITDAPATVKLGAFEVIITFTEPVSDFEADDIQLTGDVDASVTDLTTPAEGAEDHRIVWTAEITPDASTNTNGDITLTVPEDVVEDAALNNNAASGSQTIRVDATPPTVSITDVPEVGKNVAFDLTLTFSEAVSGLDVEDIALTGPATVSLTTGSDGDTEYTVTITPDDDAEGDVTIQVREDVVEDIVGNTNTASTEHTLHVDTVPPTVVISDTPEAEKNVAFDLTITFSEPVNNFVAGDITLTGPATASVKSGTDGDSVYEITITPNPTSEGNVTFQVPATAARDFAQNGNAASTETDPVHIDTIPPTVEITGVPDIEKNVAFDITITFSEPVNGFAVGNITLTGPATISLAKETDSVYKGTITPNQVSEGDVTFSIPAAIAQDSAFNDNIASDSHTVHIDTILPTVASITGVPTIEKNVPFDITITFSEPVNGFVAGDITRTGPATASLKSGSDGNSVYEITITPNPTSEGDVTFHVPISAVKDFALNNNNTASGSYTVHIDTIPPTVDISNVPTIEKNVPFDITITFSEPVNGFAVGDITRTGPATISLAKETDSVYKGTITPNQVSEGDVTFSIPAAIAQDFALNDNIASDSHTVHIDTILPTVKITGVPTIEKNVAFDITITFSEPVNGFAVGDITRTGPATVNVTSGSDGDSVYKAKITPNVISEDDVEFYVSANAVRDLALNANDEPSNRPEVHVDTIPPTIESITGIPTIEKNEAFDITITFSEPVNGFVAGDIKLTGPATASVKSGSDGDRVYEIAITPNPTSEGDVRFQVPADAAIDFAQNGNEASTETDPVHIDTIPPTVEITGVPDIEKNVAFDITITFSEPVNGFQVNDLTVDGPATRALKEGSDGNAVYIVTITPAANSEGDVSFQVLADVVTDFAQNGNEVSTETDPVHVDTIPPTVESITGIPAIEKNEAFDITITFSEPVNGFVAGDITLTGPATATLKEGNDGDNVYKVAITPNPSSEGDVIFHVPGAVVKDFALNDNTASGSHTVHIDTIPPTVEITGVPTIEQNVPFDITITFSEPVNGFAVGDITLTGPATASVKSGSDGDRVYEIAITPNPTSEGDVRFQVPADAAIDFAQNGNEASTETDPVHIDTIPPTVEITGVPDIEKNEAFDVRITFSDPVNGFVGGDIELIGPATLALKEGNDGDIIYKVAITPNPSSEGDVIFHVPAAAVKDFALNDNTASGSHTVHIDTIPPTVEITGVPTIEKNVPFDITFTFSEPINGFQVGDITRTGSATISLAKETDSVYKGTITPNQVSEGDVTFSIPAAIAQDSAFNDNIASDSHTVHIDTILPTVASITGVPTIEKNVPFDITITFSEPVNGFVAGDITRTGPATANVKSGSDGNSVYEITITPNPTSEGDVTFQVRAAAARDFAQNPNQASTETDPVHIDTIPPTVKITGVPTIEKNVAFDITITFSEPVNGFAVGDITRTGPATISLAKETDKVYKATITPNQFSEGDVTFSIPAAIAQDFALNDNIASDSHTVHIDTILPTVEITGVPTIEQNVPFDITITFSEPVNGFVVGDIELTGPATLTLKEGSDGDSIYKVAITPNPASEGDVLFHVPGAVTKDFALNANTASGNHTVHIDTIPPTVKSITGVPIIEKNVPFDVTITFSEPVNGFQASDIQLTGPAAVSLILGGDGDTVYKVKIIPDDNKEGDVVFYVSAGAAKDFGRNNSEASTEHTVHVDTIPPTVEITNVPTVEKNVAFDITITFSEPVNGFQISDITFTGPATVALKSGTDGDSVYIGTITPDSTAEGDVEFHISAAATQDFALNDNIVSQRRTVHVDTILPEVTVTYIHGDADVFESVQLEMFALQIVFSENVLEFELEDITLTGDAVIETSELTGSGSLYVLTITPHEDTDGDIIIEVLAGVAKDAATNLNTASLRQNVSVAPKWIPDPNIRTVVREELGLGDGEDFAREQLAQLTTFNGFYREIYDLTGLEYATDLISAELTGNFISDLIPLAHLTRLTTLMLDNNAIPDITPLEGLTDLTTLNLAENSIDDITPLEDLRALQVLNLSENLIRGLFPLAALTALTHLYLTSNNIDNVSPIIHLKNLAVLEISGNPIEEPELLAGLAKKVNAEGTVPSVVPDRSLASAVRRALKLGGAATITIAELQRLTALRAVSSDVRSLDGLEHATALTTLVFTDNSVTDIAPLQGLTGLLTLDLGGNGITDIEPLGGLTGLLTLDLSGNGITDIEPLENLAALTTLYLSNNSIRNFVPLMELIGLTMLELSGNSISNLNIISDLTGLLALNLSNNSITDITLLQNLTKLTTLNLSGNTVGNLNAISRLTLLTTLDLSGNLITDLTPLAKLTRITALHLNENTVSDLAALASLTNLTTLELGGNAISVLNPITTLNRLRVLDVNSNDISDAAPLAVLTQLATLDLSDNSISNVKPLQGLVNLEMLRLAGNPILDTTPLYPLVQRIPPVDVDIGVSQYPPWDVNEDGRVNATDSAIVKAAVGESGEGIVNPRTDINGDGTVDNSDLLLVTNHFDAQPGKAAPAIVREIVSGALDINTLRTLDSASLQAYLELLRAESDGSLKYQRAIALIAALLAARHPEETRLLANYPNPFNPETWIPYQLANASNVQIFIYNMQGAVIRHLKLGHQPAGYYIERKHAAFWDGKNAMGESVASGTYFYQLQTANISLLRKMVILK